MLVESGNKDSKASKAKALDSIANVSKAEALDSIATVGCIGYPLVPLSEDRFEVAFTANIIPIIQSKYPGCCINFLSFGTALDSTNMQPSDWCKMARVILSNYSSYDAFVVLHGTDTMAWTASALSFLFTGLQSNGYPNAVLSKPIIVTGAQLPLFSENSQSALSILFNTDAFQNVCGAIAAAQTGISEVCLYFYLNTLRDYNDNNWNQSTLEQLMLTNLTGEIMAGV